MNYYTAYIWPCYIFAFCLLGAQVVLVVIAWKKVSKGSAQNNFLFAKDKSIL